MQSERVGLVIGVVLFGHTHSKSSDYHVMASRPEHRGPPQLVE